MGKTYLKYGLLTIGLVILVLSWELSLEPMVLGWHTHSEQQWHFALLGVALAAVALVPPIIATVRSNRARARAESTLQYVVDSQEKTIRERTRAYEQVNLKLTQEIAQHADSAVLLRDVTNNIREVFWVSSPDGDQMLYVSPAYSEIWGAITGQLPDCPDSFLRASSGETPPTQPGPGADRSRNVDRSFQITRQDGETRWIRDRSYPVIDDAGNVTRVVGIAEDITQLKALQENLLHAQRLEAVGTLAGGIAHDFNNLLATILVSAGTLRVKTRQDDNRLKNISDITYACRQGSELVKNLMRFAHQEQTEYAPVAVTELVLKTVSMIRATFDRRITINDDVQADLWEIQGDPSQIHQLLMNLLVNARDAVLTRGTGTLTVSCRNRELNANSPYLPTGGKPGRYIEMVVMDDGPGIPIATQSKIFDPFYSTKEPGQGTGLGLSTVHGIVIAHGGKVHLESEPGDGCKFSIYIPAISGSQKNSHQQATHSLFPPTEIGSVLVVEDSDPLRNNIIEYLSELGHRVASAADGRQALAAVGANIEHLEVVILDLMIPLMSGWEVLRVLRQDHPRLSVIIMSGYADDKVQKEINRLGFEAQLTKPFELSLLDKELTRVLNKRRTS